MSFPALSLGDWSVPVPIVQGGMGIGVSMSSLAGAVAKAGGIGVLSAKIYRVGVLLYGTPPKLRSILKAVWQA